MDGVTRSTAKLQLTEGEKVEVVEVKGSSIYVRAGQAKRIAGLKLA